MKFPRSLLLTLCCLATLQLLGCGDSSAPVDKKMGASVTPARKAIIQQRLKESGDL